MCTYRGTAVFFSVWSLDGVPFCVLPVLLWRYTYRGTAVSTSINVFVINSAYWYKIPHLYLMTKKFVHARYADLLYQVSVIRNVATAVV